MECDLAKRKSRRISIGRSLSVQDYIELKRLTWAQLPESDLSIPLNEGVQSGGDNAGD